MADPTTLERAVRLLRRGLAGDPRAADDPAWGELLVRRLRRAAAEAEEAGHAPPDPAAVVDEIVRVDLCARPGETPRERMIGVCGHLVLRQGDSGYEILDAAGRDLGEVHWAPGSDGSGAPLLSVPDLRFEALDRTIGQTFHFERAGDQVYVRDETGDQLGFVHFKPGEGRAACKVISSLDRGMLHVEPERERPFHLPVRTSAGVALGAIERRFVGAAPFLDDRNRMRIRVEPGRLSAGQLWGLVVVALLAGVGDERAQPLGSGS